MSFVEKTRQFKHLKHLRDKVAGRQGALTARAAGLGGAGDTIWGGGQEGLPGGGGPGRTGRTGK